MRREVLFIGFWGVDNPLTVSTIAPHVRLLLADARVKGVTLATVERGAQWSAYAFQGLAGFRHVALKASTARPAALARALDQRRHVAALRALLRERPIGLVVARTSFAGAMAHRAVRGLDIPYVVESFEPHADYMADCGVWRRNGLFHRAGRAMDRLPLRGASFLMPVAERYGRAIAAEGFPADRIHPMPCAVDPARFAFDPAARERKRAELGWEQAIVVAYAGKFGGLYHKEAAFRTYGAMARHYAGRARFLLLTPDPPEGVVNGLVAAGVDAAHAHVLRAAPQDVPAWLSAADIATAFYRHTPSSAYLSPVKVGEYWASGLPVLFTRGVADDSAIIEREAFAGAVFDPEGNDLLPALERIGSILAMPGQRERTARLAQVYRSPRRTAEVYAAVLDALWGGTPGGTNSSARNASR